MAETTHKRKFYVYGYKPAHSKEANNFLAACDLGVDGAFKKFVDILDVVVSPTATSEQLEKQPLAIVQGYREQGCKQVGIYEVVNG